MVRRIKTDLSPRMRRLIPDGALVILSGTLKDGALGLKAIKGAGGLVFVQSPEEAEYGNMPESAISIDGSIDLVAPLATLAEEIIRRVSRQHVLV